MTRRFERLLRIVPGVLASIDHHVASARERWGYSASQVGGSRTNPGNDRGQAGSPRHFIVTFRRGRILKKRFEAQEGPRMDRVAEQLVQLANARWEEGRKGEAEERAVLKKLDALWSPKGRRHDPAPAARSRPAARGADAGPDSGRRARRTPPHEGPPGYVGSTECLFDARGVLVRRRPRRPEVTEPPGSPGSRTAWSRGSASGRAQWHSMVSDGASTSTPSP